MQARGFEETQSVYRGEATQGLVGQVRRFGTSGPAYEVLGLDGKGNVLVEVVCSGERVTYPVAEAIEDPIADTIP